MLLSIARAESGEAAAFLKLSKNGLMHVSTILFECHYVYLHLISFNWKPKSASNFVKLSRAISEMNLHIRLESMEGSRP